MEAQLLKQKMEGPEVKKPNLTGIPTQMKLNFEQRSGLSFDDVRVHYSSDKPARLGALAYTQGNEVYMGPGQERHLSHELGHVVQQKAGRVRPTGWIGGLPLNDQPELEREADRAPVQCMPAPGGQDVVQRQPDPEEEEDKEVNNIMHRFQGKGWREISKEDCKELFARVNRRETPRIRGRYAVLQRTSTGVIRIVGRRFGGTGPMGRTAAQDGAECVFSIETTELSEDPYADTAPGLFQKTAFLHGPPRKKKRKAARLVADGPASLVSQVLNAEYLHIIAHQLGGEEEEGNLIPGLHALNTAMIPLENLAADLARSNIDATYTVKMWPRPGPSIWASSATIDITVARGGIWHTESVFLDIDANGFNLLAADCLHRIQSSVSEALGRINQFLSAGQEQ